MNKFFKALLFVILLVIIIVGIVFSYYKYQNYQEEKIAIEEYNNRIIYTENVNCNISTNTITNNTLVTPNLCLKFNTAKLLESNFEFVIDFYEKSGTKIQNIMFDYIIYDQNKNILGMVPDNGKNFLYGFAKENYNATNFLDANHKIGTHYIYDTQISILPNIDNPNKNTLSRIISSKGLKSDYQFNQITISLFKIQYQLLGNSEFESLDNTEFKLNINFENQ